MKASNAARPSAFVSAIQISCNSRLAFGCWLFGSLASTYALVHPAALLARFRPYFAGGFPEAQRAVGDGEFRPHVEPTTLHVEQQAAPIVCAFPCPIGKTDQLLLTL